MMLPTKSIERTLIKRGVKWIAAVDEVGRGSWAGPVVAAAVLFHRRFILRPPRPLHFIRDSKLLLPKTREYFYTLLTEPKRGNIMFGGSTSKHGSGIVWAVASVTPALIDRLNIHRATFRAMARAIQKLPQQPDIVLVDGIFSIPGVALPQEVYPHGDRRIFSIAAASIIAKVTRDRMMVRLAKKYPEYGFEKHKGYGTKLHQAQLASFGPSAIHRQSYKPVAMLA